MNKYKKMKWSIGLVLILFMILVPGITQADLKDILLKFQPYIAVQEEYSTNIDLTPKNKKDDFITSIYPGIRFSTLKRSDVSGELRGPSDPRKKSTESIWTTVWGWSFTQRRQTTIMLVTMERSMHGTPLPTKLTFRISEYLIRSEEPREQEYPGTSPTYISGSFVDLTDLYLLGTSEKVYLSPECR